MLDLRSGGSWNWGHDRAESIVILRRNDVLEEDCDLRAPTKANVRTNDIPTSAL